MVNDFEEIRSVEMIRGKAQFLVRCVQVHMCNRVIFWNFLFV